MDLSSQAWADIADRSFETIKGHMFAPYRDGAAYEADGFDRLFKSPEHVDWILDFACGVGRNLPVLRPVAGSCTDTIFRVEA